MAEPGPVRISFLQVLQKFNRMIVLKGKSVIITGASRGIGRALALRLAEEGARLALLARSESELLEVQQEVEAKGAGCLVFAGDVSDEAYVQAAVQSVISAWGTLDLLINNAGFGIFKQSEEISGREWDRVFATNVKGTFLLCNAVIPAMKQQQSGHIINIASDVAKRVFAGGSLYCASKYAQDAYSMAIRKELRSSGIKVSVVYSGLVDSSFHAEPQGHNSHSWWLKNEDMANAICFIAAQPAHVVIDELMIHPLQQEY